MIPLTTWVAAKEWYISMSKESKARNYWMKWHVNIRVFRKGQRGRHLEHENDDFDEQSRFLRGSFSGSWKSTSKMLCKTVLHQVSPSEMLETVRSSSSGTRSGRSFFCSPPFRKWWFCVLRGEVDGEVDGHFWLIKSKNSTKCHLKYFQPNPQPFHRTKVSLASWWTYRRFPDGNGLGQTGHDVCDSP